MKKHFAVLFAALFILMGTSFAQGPQRMSVEERVKIALDKIDAGLKPSESVRASAKTILYNAYTAQSKKMEDLFAGGNRPDREEMQKIRQQFTEELDQQLKTVFSQEQFSKWKTEIEPSLNPRRGNPDKKEQ